MTRRIFMLFGFYALTRPLSAKKTKITHWNIINATLNHLFPKSQNFANASQLNLLNFFKLNSTSKYFDKVDLVLFINGSKALYKMDKNYLNLSKSHREKLLREFEQTNLGQNWLSTLMYYGFEAMLSDPIYGANHDMQGWNALNHNPGIPRPTKIYGKNNV